jgi:tripartite-type tricarboxylate transporter receptor subunit TctC
MREQSTMKAFMRTPAHLAAAALLVAGSNAVAQPYPSKPVRIVLGFPAGTTVDVLARPIAQKLGERFGQQFIVDNRPGATGMIANELVAKAAPDGYVLLVAPGSSITSNPHLRAKMPYDTLKDLAPISQIGAFPYVLIAHPNVPVKTVKELIALAKAKPGFLSFGSSGIGSGFHLAGEMLRTLAHIDILHVPYKGGNLALTELAAGDIDFMFYSLAVAQPLIKAGKVRPIGVTGQKADPLLAHVPPLSQSGLPGYDMTGWHGFFAPGATPRDVVNQLNGAIVQILGLPEMRQLWATSGMEVVTNTPEQFAAKVRSEYERYGKLVRAAGIKPQ